MCAIACRKSRLTVHEADAIGEIRYRALMAIYHVGGVIDSEQGRRARGPLERMLS